MNVYPNPTNGVLNINSKSSIITINITDLNGRLIQASNQNNNQVAINVENLQSGIYLLKITTESGVSTQKIIKE